MSLSNPTLKEQIKIEKAAANYIIKNNYLISKMLKEGNIKEVFIMIYKDGYLSDKRAEIDEAINDILKDKREELEEEFEDRVDDEVRQRMNDDNLVDFNEILTHNI